MKIVSETTDEMVIEDRAFFFQIIYTIVFFLLSIALFYFMILKGYYVGLWIPTLLFLLALLCLGSKEKIITRIDRKGKKIIVEAKRRFITNKIEYSLEDIATVKAQRTWKLLSMDTGGVGFYLVLKNGENVRINLSMNSFVYLGELPYMHPLPKNFLQIGEEIARFIGTPYEKVGRFGPLLTKGY